MKPSSANSGSVITPSQIASRIPASAAAGFAQSRVWNGGSRRHDDYDLGPSVALPVPEMVLGGAAPSGAAGGSTGLANCCAASALVRLVSASGPAAKPASVRILSMIGL